MVFGSLERQVIAIVVIAFLVGIPLIFLAIPSSVKGKVRFLLENQDGPLDFRTAYHRSRSHRHHHHSHRHHEHSHRTHDRDAERRQSHSQGEHAHESGDRGVNAEELSEPIAESPLRDEEDLLREEERSYATLATAHSVKEVPFSPTGKYLTFSEEPFETSKASPVASRSADLVAGAFVYLFFCGLAAALFALAVQSVIPLDVAEDAALTYLEEGKEGLQANRAKYGQQTSSSKGLSPAESDSHLRGLYESLPVFVGITVVLFAGGIVSYFRWMQAGVAVNQRPRYRSNHSLNERSEN